MKKFVLFALFCISLMFLMPMINSVETKLVKDELENKIIRNNIELSTFLNTSLIKKILKILLLYTVYASIYSFITSILFCLMFFSYGFKLTFIMFFGVFLSYPYSFIKNGFRGDEIDLVIIIPFLIIFLNFIKSNYNFSPQFIKVFISTIALSSVISSFVLGNM